ncbi:hypothetical protein [Christensenella timonensis]|uniref:hypothetical protein n=1 Tax=Christensenella timonensis TaxID=1816678 RepID=UPI00083373C0|nr:hypothetical protein [Christensenella timonensis]
MGKRKYPGRDRKVRALRNILILLIAVVVFVFVFAGHSDLDQYLPLMETKGAVTTMVFGGVYDLGGGDYLVRLSDKDAFVDKMLEDGWVMQPDEDRKLVFEKDGQDVAYQESGFLGGFTIYRLVPR